MNKKKFFATCTLVAFGATMVPAMAFGATDGDASEKGALGVLSTTNLRTDDDKTIAIKCHVEDTWVSANDTIEIVKVEENGAPSEPLKGYIDNTTAITAYNPGDPDASSVVAATAGSISLKLAKPLPVGSYSIILRNTEAENDADKTKSARADDVAATDPDATAVTAVSAEAGMMTFGTVGANKKIFDLGTEYNWIPADATEAAAQGASEAELKVPAKSLVENHFYGIGTAGSVPNAVYFCSKAEIDKAKAAVAELKTNLQKGIDTLPSNVVLEVADLNMGNLATAIAAKITDEDFAADDLYILEVAGNGQLKTYVDRSADVSYNSAKDAYVAGTDVAVEKVPGGVAYLEGTVKVVAARTGVAEAYSTIKTINVTIRKISANLPKAVDAYGKDKFADYNESDNTASATLTKVGDGFEKDTIKHTNASTTATFTIAAENVKLGETSLVGAEVVEYFKDGKVVKLPAEDITMDVILDAGDSKTAGQFITVKTTIKAAGGNSDAIQEAIDNTNAAIDEFIVVYGEGRDNSTSATAPMPEADWNKVKEAYAKVLKEYQEYLKLVNA